MKVATLQGVPAAFFKIAILTAKQGCSRESLHCCILDLCRSLPPVGHR